MTATEIKIVTVRECAAEYVARTPQGFFDFWKSEIEKAGWYQSDKECFVVVMLSAKNHIKGYNLVSMGLVDASLVHPREVYRPAIISGAKSILVAHNHPSGESTPSAEDIRVTRQLVEAGKIIDIKLLDHLIIGEGFCSMREQGLATFEC